MGAAENKEIVRRALDGSGGPNALVEALAPDVRWTIFGQTKFSGTWHSPEELREKLWGPLFELIETPGSMTIDLLLADGDHVVCQFHTEGRFAKGHQPYDQFYCAVFRLENGKIVESDEYMDTQLIDLAFGAVSKA